MFMNHDSFFLSTLITGGSSLDFLAKHYRQEATTGDLLQLLAHLNRTNNAFFQEIDDFCRANPRLMEEAVAAKAKLLLLQEEIVRRQSELGKSSGSSGSKSGRTSAISVMQVGNSETIDTVQETLSVRSKLREMVLLTRNGMMKLSM